MQHGECLFILFNFSSIKYVFPPLFLLPKTIKTHTHIFFTIMEKTMEMAVLSMFWHLHTEQFNLEQSKFQKFNQNFHIDRISFYGQN